MYYINIYFKYWLYFKVAPGDIPIDKNGYIIGTSIPVRFHQEFIVTTPNDVDYVRYLTI